MFRKNILVSAIILFVVFTGCADRDKTTEEWTSLFNGTDLSGWIVNALPEDLGKEYWKVEDGSITCNSMGDPEHNYVWLSTKGEYDDFHLKLKFQLFRDSRGNSGVQFRSRYDASANARFGGWLNGPQADIHGPVPFRTGLIYDETEGVQRWIHPSLSDWNIEPDQAPESALDTELCHFEDDPQKWNSMEIICRDMDIKTLVNGNLVSDFNGEGLLNDEIHRARGSGERGKIALQLHMHDELKIRFKDIYIKEF